MKRAITITPPRFKHQQGSLPVNPATLKIAHSGPLTIVAAIWFIILEMIELKTKQKKKKKQTLNF